jgi:hypothetical protein
VHLTKEEASEEKTGGLKFFNLIRAFVAKKGFWNKKIYE